MRRFVKEKNRMHFFCFFLTVNTIENITKEIYLHLYLINLVDCKYEIILTLVSATSFKQVGTEASNSNVVNGI